MEFGRAHGRAWQDALCGSQMLHIAVTLETRASVLTVRDECVSELRQVLGVEDLTWHADQYTQETIGTDLALQGWEAISRTVADDERGGVDRATVTYVVRRV